MCKRLGGRGTKRHSCGRLQVGPSSVVVQTSKSGMVWGRIVGGRTIQRTDGRPDQCEQEE